MDPTRKKRLAKAGWRVGTAREFLGLSPSEAALLELKLALATELRRRREKEGLTQAKLARRLASSQSRVAKMEAGDPTVSLDLLVRGLLGLGATVRDLARTIEASRRRPAA
ncbi:MAG: helix-turn-helix domain-containing protein [bacterium]